MKKDDLLVDLTNDEMKNIDGGCDPVTVAAIIIIGVIIGDFIGDKIREIRAAR